MLIPDNPYGVDWQPVRPAPLWRRIVVFLAKVAFVVTVGWVLVSLACLV